MQAAPVTPDLLEYKTVRLWPYAPGYYARDILYRLWLLQEKDNLARRLFYLQKCEKEEQRGDLPAFCKSMDSRIILAIEHAGKLVGCWWFDDVQERKANIGLFMAKSALGNVTRDAGIAVLRYAFAVYGWTWIFGFTPWRDVVKLAKDIGFTHVSTIPSVVDMYGTGEHWRDLYVVRMGKDEYNALAH